MLTLSAPTPQNGQTHSNNSSAIADKLFERVWTFCGVGAEMVKWEFGIPIKSKVKGSHEELQWK